MFTEISCCTEPVINNKKNRRFNTKYKHAEIKQLN